MEVMEEGKKHGKKHGRGQGKKGEGEEGFEGALTPFSSLQWLPGYWPWFLRLQ
jgi:hypothetical protein